MGRKEYLSTRKPHHTLVLHEPGKVAAGFSLEEVVKNADGIFCVPSWVMRSGLQDVRPWLRSDAVVVSLPKVLSVKRICGRIVCGSSADRHPLLCSRPNHAEEIFKAKEAQQLWQQPNGRP